MSKNDNRNNQNRNGISSDASVNSAQTIRGWAKGCCLLKTKRALSWIAVIVMAGIIFWMSANTGQNINQGLGIISTIKEFLTNTAFTLTGRQVDVSPIGHFIEYFIFGLLLFNALRYHLSMKGALILALTIASAYGITDEIHQLFVPERSSDPLDWIVDTIASGLGALSIYMIMKAELKRSNRS